MSTGTGFCGAYGLILDSGDGGIDVLWMCSSQTVTSKELSFNWEIH